MMAEKWDVKTHKYEPYTLPKGCYLYSEDMDATVACAQCGKIITYGEGYTSKQVHNQYGLGYPVCEDCYTKEIDEEQKGRT
jgi:hypothetical protein